MAQESGATLAPDSQQETKADTAQEPEPQQTDSVPDSQQEGPNESAQRKESAQTDSFGVQSILDQISQNTKNHIGFSLGVNHNFTSRAFYINQQNKVVSYPSFNARLFFNVPGKKSQFHFDVGSAYRMYKKGTQQLYRSWSLNGNAQFTRQLSKSTTLAVSDHVYTVHNDSDSLESIYSTSYFGYEHPSSYYNYGFSSEILLDRQQITVNDLTGSFNVKISRKSYLDIIGDYQTYKFLSSDYANADAVTAGASFGYQFTSWLALSSSYSVYLNEVDKRYRDSRTQSLRIGELNLRFRRYWRVWAGGGVQFSGDSTTNRAYGTVNAGIIRSAGRFSMGVRYQRGLTSVIGLSSLLYSDVVNASMGFSLKRRLTLRLSSVYYRNSEYSGGVLRAISNGGGLQFAITNNLIASASYVYQNQKASNFSVPGLSVNRSVGSVGLQFVWPSRRRISDFDRATD
jgi:hypothetical protein